MSKVIISLFVLMLTLGPVSLKAQSPSVHPKFGLEIDFPEGWMLMGESLYSSILQTQLFFDKDTLHMVQIERYLSLRQVDKNNWHNGLPYGNLFGQAKEIRQLAPAEWPLDMPAEDEWPGVTPGFGDGLIPAVKSGAAVYELQLPETAVYVVFLARGDSFIRFSVGTMVPGYDLNTLAVKQILKRIRVSPEEPQFPEDPYTIAERADIFEQNYEAAKLLYARVPEDHPKYGDAQKRLKRLNEK